MSVINVILNRSYFAFQNDPFNVGPEVQYLSPTRNMNISMASVGQLMSSFNDPFNTSFVSGSLTTPAGDFNSYTSTPVPVSVPVNDGVGIVAGPNLGPSDKKCSLFSEISNIPTASVRDGSDPTDGGTSATVGSSHTNSTEASLLNEGFLANRSEDVSNTEFLVGSDQPLGCSTLIPQQMVPTFAFSDLDPLGKDRPYIDKKDFFQDVKNPPKKVLKDLMAENGFATSDFGFMPAESPVSSFQVSNFDTLSAFPPPNAPPPPLPSSFYRRSLTSPTSSLEDASMAGSASSTSSVESTTSSPVYEVLLPPPPPPPPRPHANMPTFLPPPPPLPPKHNRSPPPECGAGSPTTEAPLPVPSSGMTGVLSSPPIPIPSRRSRGAFTSLSSTSTSLSSSMSMSSSLSNRSSQNGFASDGSVSLNSPAPLEADANNNPSLVPNGYQQQRQQQLSSTTRSSNGIQSWNMNEANTVGNMNKSNMSNPFLGDIFISPPPQHTMGTRRSNGNLGSTKKMQPGIFQKEGNPFEDDEFFAALKSVNDTGRTSEGATTPNGNVIGGLWNDPFEDNFAQNR